MVKTSVVVVVVAVATVAVLVLPRQEVPLQAIEEKRHLRDAKRARKRAENATTSANDEVTLDTKSGHQRTAAKESALVLRFDEVDQNDADLVGGKGAHLGHLSSAGLPIPSGFCVTREAYFQGISGHSEQTERVREAVKIAYEKLTIESGEDAIVAVRSSATCEDSQDASFAGQLESYLGLKGFEEVWHGVLKCWDSLKSDRVVAYNSTIISQEDTLGDKIACCVVVQIMVDASCAGVLFTVNPVTGNRTEATITGSWGLGEAVVSDLVTPDTWIVDRETQRIKERKLSKEKTRMYTMDKSLYKGSYIVDVEPEALRSTPCLSDKELSELVVLGNRIEQVYDSPRDIEWAFASSEPTTTENSGQRTLQILQARPVTTLSKGYGDGTPPPTINEFDSKCRPTDWITTCNAAEMFPGAGTPLSISTFGRAANLALQIMHYSFGVRDDINEEESVVGWFYGFQFLNMTNTLRVMCGGMIGASMAKENGEMAILGRVNDKCSLQEIIAANGSNRASLVRRLINGLRYACTSLLAIPLRLPRLQERLKNVKSLNLESAPLYNNNPAELWRQLDNEQANYISQWSDGVILSNLSAAFLLATMKIFCMGSHTKPWSTEAVAEVSCLIASGSSNESVAESCDAVQSLDAIAADLLNDREQAHGFVSMDPAQLLPRLEAASALFVETLKRHGHRCIKEAEMRTLEWSKDPLPLVRQIQSCIRAHLARDEANADGSPLLAQKAKVATVDEVLARNSHLYKVQAWLLRGVSTMAREGVRHRELGKSLCIAYHTELKRGYRRLGLQLSKVGRLPDPDLVYFLTHDELGELCCEPVCSTEMHRLRMRAMQRRRLLPLQERLVFKDLHKGRPEPTSRTDFAENMFANGNSSKITGTPVCIGDAQGPARVVRTLEEAHAMQPGEILICPQTDVGWTPVSET